jgi:hypothetical protein
VVVSAASFQEPKCRARDGARAVAVEEEGKVFPGAAWGCVEGMGENIEKVSWTVSQLYKRKG